MSITSHCSQIQRHSAGVMFFLSCSWSNVKFPSFGQPYSEGKYTKTVCFTCIMPLHKYFCPTFQCYFRCLLLFKLFQSTRFKKKTALFNNPIEMKYSLDVCENVKTRTAPDLSLGIIAALLRPKGTVLGQLKR